MSIFFKNKASVRWKYGAIRLLPAVGICLLLILSSVVQSARLQSVEVKQNAGKISLFFSLDQPIPHKIFTLTNPERVVVDFEKTDLSVNLNQLHLNNQLIRRVRSGHPNPSTLRLVFEVTDAVLLRSTSPNASTRSRNEFSLDISARHHQHSDAGIIKTDSGSGVPIVQKTDRRPQRDVIIVLDPGHGGKDPGAMGPAGSREKNVTLAMALRLKKLIDSQPGMKAVMTRNGDNYVGLRERLNIARKQGADVFISIHADAFINKQSNGASVFALSQRGATSEAARWLAEKENYSELGGVNLRGLDDQTGLVRTVLIDLSQTATIAASLHMGEGVLRNLNTLTRLHNHKVEQARFMVLKSPDIPSILIETGFISNPREERNLTSPAYQTQLTQAIFHGLKHYFQEYPPHGTRIVAGVGSSTHIVRAGESLIKIAARYHISPAALKNASHLSTDQVRIGQKLTLPAAS